MSKVTALYLRTSTDRQDSGLEAQQRALEDYCNVKGIKNYKVFKDKGISGAKASRPKLDELMDLVIDGKVKSVIVYSFSRFARSTKHLLEALEVFQEFKTDFVSISEQVDTSSPVGKAFFTIIAAISQLERELISERVSNGLKNAVAKGKVLGRPRTEKEKSIISLRAKGLTYRQISDVLDVGQGTITRVLRRYTENEDL